MFGPLTINGIKNGIWTIFGKSLTGMFAMNGYNGTNTF